MKIRVGVIYGGVSVEHEISIISAVQAMSHIDTEKYEIVPIYIAKDRTWYTGNMLLEMDVYKDFETLKRYATKVSLINKNGEFVLQSQGFFKRVVNTIDVAFPIVHGQNVEDGTLAGYLETLGIPCVGPNVLGAALGQDKVVMKQVFAAEGLPIVPYTWFYDVDYLNNEDEIARRVEELGYPVIVKPASLGSSIGIVVVKDSTKLDEAIIDAINYDTKVIIEKVVPNLVEVNCSVLGTYEYQQTSVIEEVMSKQEFLTYQEKYLGSGKKKGAPSKGMASTDRIIPARISDELRTNIENLSKRVFRALNLSGICRIDYLINKETNEVFINEPNTIPGSLSFYLWEPAGKKYTELLDEVITLTIKEFKNRSKKTYSFDTNVLSNFSGTKGVKGLKGVKK